MITKKDVLTATRRPLSLAISSLLGAALFLPAPSFAAQTTRVSVASDGTQGNRYSFSPSISADERYVAFASPASNLVPGDTNGHWDVFVKDLKTQQTTRVSVASDGTQSNHYSSNPRISADGRYVAFESVADNLVAGDTNGFPDIFVKDLKTQQTTQVSVASDGTQGNYPSYFSSISADGRYVAFESIADNLVAGDTNGYSDVYVKDLKTKQTTRVSVTSDGTQGVGSFYGSLSPSISSDGRFVTFLSGSNNLVAGDTNNAGDIFVNDLKTHQTTRVSVASDGTQGNDFSVGAPNISADGRYVAFASTASNLVAGDTNISTDVFVKDLKTQQTTRVSVASDGREGYHRYGSYNPRISADGRFVAFVSIDSNLVAGDTNGTSDVYVKDLKTQQLTRVSVANDGTQSNKMSGTPSISADGSTVIFRSDASNLVAGDTNNVGDIFVHDRWLKPALGNADLSVAQMASAGVVSFGSTFSYTATIQNHSKTVSSGYLTLTDIAFLGDNVSGPLSFKVSQGGCSKGPISVCRLGPLAPGQQATVSIDFKALKPGRVSNRVSINSGRIDPVYKNDVAVSSVTIK